MWRHVGTKRKPPRNGGRRGFITGGSCSLLEAKRSHNITLGVSPLDAVVIASFLVYLEYEGFASVCDLPPFSVYTIRAWDVVVVATPPSLHCYILVED